MAKRIFGEVVAECISADPASPAKALSWSSWRRDFIGLTGWLKIYESEKKSPGRPFLYLVGRNPKRIGISRHGTVSGVSKENS